MPNISPVTPGSKMHVQITPTNKAKPRRSLIVQKQDNIKRHDEKMGIYNPKKKKYKLHTLNSIGSAPISGPDLKRYAEDFIEHFGYKPTVYLCRGFYPGRYLSVYFKKYGLVSVKFQRCKMGEMEGLI